MITQYRCPACQVGSSVEILDPDLTRHGEATANTLAQMRLEYATCPACGARNPVGVLDQQRDERNLAIFTMVMMVGLSVGAYFAPWIVLGWLGLFAAFYVYFLSKRPTWAVAFNLATTLALGVVVWFVPRWAFLLLAVPTIQLLIRRRDPAERDQPWQRAAEQLRFFDTSQRRP